MIRPKVSTMTVLDVVGVLPSVVKRILGLRASLATVLSRMTPVAAMRYEKPDSTETPGRRMTPTSVVVVLDGVVRRPHARTTGSRLVRLVMLVPCDDCVESEVTNFDSTAAASAWICDAPFGGSP